MTSEPAPIDILRFGDETRHDPTTKRAADERRRRLRAYERLRRERLISYLPETGRRA